MMSTPLLNNDDSSCELRQTLATAAKDLAQRGIYLGTSSWKYEGWLGQLHTRERYLTHGKWSRSKFQKKCLAEFAEVFKTVCLDAGFYHFPGDQFRLLTLLVVLLT